MKKQEKIIKEINKVIDKMRPYLINDGGDVEFVKYEDGVVYVKLVGACAHCGLAPMTLQEGIETALVNEIPEVIKVVSID